MEENGGSLTDETTKEARIMSTRRLVAGETRRRLKIRHNRKHKIQKVLGVLSDHKSESREHRETCSGDIEQVRPLEEDDFLLDVNGGFHDLRPSHFGARQQVEPQKSERSAQNFGMIRNKHPKLVIRWGIC